MARSESFENGTNSESFVLSSGFGDHLFLFFPSIMLKIRPRASEPLFQSAHLCIRGIGIHEVMPPCFVRRPDGTGDYLFMIFHSSVQIGALETTPVEPGMMVLWERGAAHFYGNPTVRWGHSWIHCDGRDIRKAWKAAGIHTGQPILISNPSRAEDYLLSIYEELTGPMEPDGVIIRNTLGNLIQEAARSRTRPQTSPSRKICSLSGNSLILPTTSALHWINWPQKRGFPFRTSARSSANTSAHRRSLILSSAGCT